MPVTSLMTKHGNNGFTLRYHELVIKNDIPKLDAVWHKQIETAIAEKLTNNPIAFGIPLRQSLKGYWKLRVGNYRVVFKITNTTVFIIAIEHRSVVYKKILTRIRLQR